MKAQEILTVTLNPAVDKTFRLKVLRPGQDHRVGDIQWSAGGKGINVSRALKHLGTKSLATGLIAGAAGEFILKSLKQEGIRADFIPIEGETRTNLTVLSGNKKQPTRFIETGPVVSRKSFQRFVKKYTTLVQKTAYVIFSGRSACGLPDDVYASLIRTVKESRVKTVLDTSGIPFRAGITAGPYCIKPNLGEAEFILQHKLRSRADFVKGMNSLHRKGIEVVIISLGEKGAVGSKSGEIWQVRPPKVRAVNTVGCGDVLIAGFIQAEREGRPFKDALRFSVAAGTASALTLRPGEISRRAVEKIFRKVEMAVL